MYALSGNFKKFKIFLLKKNPNLEENEESPESEEEADPAEELDESVGIVSCWMVILHPAGEHDLNDGDESHLPCNQSISYQLNEQH